MVIGDRLRELREQKNLSQGDIEKRTGLLRCYISRVENGHTVPAIETLEKLARALEIPMYQLFYDGMQIGRTSCSNFLANTFRVLLTAAAYVLMQEMRLHLAPTRHARAQVSTLREHFLKLGAQVIVTVRRIVLHLPQAFPYRDSFHRLALSLGAQTG